MAAVPAPLIEPYYVVSKPPEASVEVTMDFLRQLVPASVWGEAGDRRLRHTRGKASRGFLMFYRQGAAGSAPQRKPLRKPMSVQRYLAGQLAAPDLAEHWVCLASTQYSAKMLEGETTHYRAEDTRHLLAMVVDLDPGRMAPEHQVRIRQDWPGFVAQINSLLADIGITGWCLVRSSALGAHVYVPLIGRDGRPLGGNPKTRKHWSMTAQALCRYFAFHGFGADSNAVKVTQPFAVPGLPRLKHAGWVPYVAGGRRGPASNLYTLLRALSNRRLVFRTAQPTLEAVGAGGADEFLADLERVEEGLADGRKRSIYGIAVAALAKGASADRAWAALQTYNRKCAVPLPERELRKAFGSAQRCPERHPDLWPVLRAAPWNRLRAELGMCEVERAGYSRNGRWHPLTPPKPREQRVREHYGEVEERLVRFVAGHGGRIRLPQSELVDALGSNRSTLKVVLGLLAAAGRLQVTGKRGANGYTELALPSPAESTINGHSGIAPIGGVEGQAGGSRPDAAPETCPAAAETLIAGAPTAPCPEVGAGKDSQGVQCLGSSAGDLADHRQVGEAAYPATAAGADAHGVAGGAFPEGWRDLPAPIAVTGIWRAERTALLPVDGGVVAVMVSRGDVGCRGLFRPGASAAAVESGLLRAIRRMPSWVERVWRPELSTAVELVVGVLPARKQCDTGVPVGDCGGAD